MKSLKAIILAAGIAKRLQPLSLKKPKALFPVANLTVIERVIRLLESFGIQEAIINLHSRGDQIEEFLGDGSNRGISLFYSWEKKLLGTAGAIAKTRDFFGDETFLVINSDILTSINLKEAFDFHQRKEALATLVLTKADVTEYGAVRFDEEGYVRSLLEKPLKSEAKFEAVYTGLAFFEPRVFKYIPRGYVSFAEIILKLLDKGQKVCGFLADGYWQDIGTPERYFKANWDILDRKVEAEIPGVEVEKGIWIQKGVQINARAQLFAPVVIGSGAIIEAKVELGPYVIVGDNSFLDIESVIKKSIIWNDVFIGKNTILEKCIVENGFTINPLTKSHDTILSASL